MENRLLSHRLASVIRDFNEPVMIWQAAILVGALAFAWVAARFVHGRIDARRRAAGRPPGAGAQSLKRALFPLFGGLFVLAAQLAFEPFMSTSLLSLALVPLFGIGLIYVLFFFARRVFARDGHSHAWLSIVEKLVSVIVWAAMVLTVLGIQRDVLDWLDSVQFRVANAHLTLLSLISGALWVCVTLMVAMWLGSVLEDRLARASTLDANLRVVLSRVGRALLVFAAVLIGLSLVGIDVTVLGVFGGAVGVGLGFGLQKIASNYVSGFIILLDRSLRLGDAISVGGLQGVVTQIRTRYTVVRGLDGNETLIPNEKLITDVVQNQSSYLTRGYAKLAVQVAYTNDVEQALALLAEAARGVPRVLDEPAPTPFLAGFGADGIDLELGFWIADAATGTGSVRSNVNRNIWRLFHEHGISIPYPQREVRVIGLPDALGGTVRAANEPPADGGAADAAPASRAQQPAA
ncbi:mechanosensitive ion channel family protein [Burkholderia multivorans]|uniref:Mechanosensitive ion channel protein MscS n=1 Tax=Burkholderia multivorans TaxID=87883 RepID=A0A2S9M772_9BURK|nr:mechanosensitive ion channel domain-containing protein [Burkholderia multivorans]MBU9515786.1 mechanosensitive ion channel [Burkholderia multivorans]MBU9523971.1 mechanosensitive ion channel [Burkholderia multivorans]MBU9636733.1 mechanosensitive ion channel [Burkholderia multivorans]PRF12066.1 mechanosensitive ion channel protein MscS [Burkholderia multivorans]PRF52761.1 mechanosensitive ion channel protein MscS [Burkholderia multivorans]